MADDFNKPNVVIPLAASYDTRGLLSGANAIQSNVDQLKINCYYDVIQNPVTGKSTLELVKRPGVSLAGQLNKQLQRTYLISDITKSQSPWVFGVDAGGDIYVTNFSTSQLIHTSTPDLYPAYVAVTLISGTPTAVLQVRAGNSTALRAYYASSISSWTEITDSTFTALTHRGAMAFIDGYALVMDSNNRIYSSGINTLATWDDSNFVTKQIQQDRAAGLFRFKQQILAFGDETVEVFVNAGNPSGSPLSAAPALAQKYGLGRSSGNTETGSGLDGLTHYACVLKEKMYFVGREAGGQFPQGVYSYDGQNFAKVSTATIDRIVTTYSNSYSITPVGFVGKSAVAVQLTGPGTSAAVWLMYFPDLNEWFQWSSTKFSPVNDSGYFIAAADGDNNVSKIDIDTRWTDIGTTITSAFQFKLPKGGNQRDFMRWCALDADTSSSANGVTVKFSDDDYQTFDAGRTIDLTTLEKRINRCGSYKNRAVRIEHTANAEFRARNFLARID